MLKNYKFYLLVLPTLLLSFFILFFAFNTSNSTVFAQGNSNTCPQDDGWVKIDSGDLSMYPVDGATSYCFKAGNFLTDSIPDGGFGQDGGCNEENIQNCGLSHWSYFIGDGPVVNPFVRVTYICKAETDGSPEGYDIEMVAGEHLWRIRHEDGPSTDFYTNFLPDVQGYIEQNETLLFSTTQHANGVKVYTSPLSNQYGGTASVSGAICDIPEEIKDPSWQLTKTVVESCVEGEDGEIYAKGAYTIRIENVGDGSGYVAEVVDELDSKVIEDYLYDVKDDGQYSNGEISWISGEHGWFEPGESKEFKYELHIPESDYGTYDNTVNAYSALGDSEVITLLASDSVSAELVCEIEQTYCEVVEEEYSDWSEWTVDPEDDTREMRTRTLTEVDAEDNSYICDETTIVEYRDIEDEGDVLGEDDYQEEEEDGEVLGTGIVYAQTDGGANLIIYIVEYILVILSGFGIKFVGKKYLTV